MYESKYFVVVIVLATVFVGIAGYLIYLDIKTRKLEKQLNDKEKD
ncbi:MAG: CcmD family protein [Bacteroidales bacterium]|nr:CcmD family protein [Bacteroidales bacterium]MBK7175021.1 CcmD family protein [Bacteroidales bacterium]